MKYGFALIILVSIAACTSVTATRPDQELAQAVYAVKAAKEVQADTLSPGMYRKATELLEEAKRDYRLKNYEESKYNLKRARLAAEAAELAALKSGGSRNGPQAAPTDPMAGAPAGMGMMPGMGNAPMPGPQSTPSPTH